MSFQPELTQSLCSIKETNYHCIYKNCFFRLDDPAIDESHIHTCYEIYVNVSGDVSFLHNKTINKIQCYTHKTIS